VKGDKLDKLNRCLRWAWMCTRPRQMADPVEMGMQQSRAFVWLFVGVGVKKKKIQKNSSNCAKTSTTAI
jgi:hypothetical protein